MEGQGVGTTTTDCQLGRFVRSFVRSAVEVGNPCRADKP